MPKRPPEMQGELRQHPQRVAELHRVFQEHNRKANEHILHMLPHSAEDLKAQQAAINNYDHMLQHMEAVPSREAVERIAKIHYPKVQRIYKNILGDNQELLQYSHNMVIAPAIADPKTLQASGAAQVRISPANRKQIEAAMTAIKKEKELDRDDKKGLTNALRVLIKPKKVAEYYKTANQHLALFDYIRRYHEGVGVKEPLTVRALAFRKAAPYIKTRNGPLTNQELVALYTEMARHHPEFGEEEAKVGKAVFDSLRRPTIQSPPQKPPLGQRKKAAITPERKEAQAAVDFIIRAKREGHPVYTNHGKFAQWKEPPSIRAASKIAIKLEDDEVPPELRPLLDPARRKVLLAAFSNPPKKP